MRRRQRGGCDCCGWIIMPSETIKHAEHQAAGGVRHYRLCALCWESRAWTITQVNEGALAGVIPYLVHVVLQALELGPIHAQRLVKYSVRDEVPLVDEEDDAP